MYPSPQRRERFSLSFFPGPSMSEPGFSQLSFSSRLTPGPEIQTQRPDRGAEARYRLVMSDSDPARSPFFSHGREETGQWTSVLREP